MSSELERQVERILDESGDARIEVIVQTEPGDQRVTTLMRTAAAAVRSRRSLNTARDLVPPPRDALVGRQRAAMRSRAGPAAASLAFAQEERAGRAGTLGDAHRRGTQALGPLLKWGQTEGVAPAASGGARSAAVFTASGSAVMSLERDKLARLPKEVNNLSAIYRNQRVAVPPVSKSTGEPRVVWENRGHTWGVSRTGALACWGAYEARGQDIKIAVLDTGVDASHPDLQPRLAGFARFDDQGRTVADGVEHASDSEQHGTHVCGTVAGGNASGRWIGMAPRAKLLCGMVLPDGGGTDAQILGGMQWALDHGADIISLSLGGLRLTPDVLDTYTRMIITANRAGVPVVVAVGNEGAQTSGSPGNDYFAFTVGATDVEDVAAGFSGGRTQVIQRSRYIAPEDLPLVYSKPDISAPGVDVYSAVPATEEEPQTRYATFSGTSMATPHVAGAMALLLSALPGLRALHGADRVNVLQQLLLSSVRELGEAGQNHRYGFGRLDVLRAVGFGRELGY